MSKNVVTPYFRVSYPNVFRPRKNDLSGRDEYSLVALFKKGEDLKKLKEAAEEAAIAKWGPDKKKWPRNLRTPFRDQEDRGKETEDGETVLPPGYEAGAFYLNLKTTNKPGLVDANREEILDETDFYGGCWARASVRAFAYSVKGNNGVSFGLQHIQKYKDDEPFGNRTTAEEDFEPIKDEDGESAEDVFSM